MRNEQSGASSRHPEVPDTPRFHAELERYLAGQVLAARPGGHRRPSHHRLVAAAILATALAAALAVLLVAPVTGSRPVAVAEAESFVLPDGTTVSVEEFFDATNFDRLRRLFAAHGAELIIHERPVAGRAVERVFSVMTDFGGQPDSDPRVVGIQPGERVEVEVGRVARAGEQVDTEGLTLYEVFPALPEAIDRADPIGTEAALRDLGFQVQWVLLDVAFEDGVFDNSGEDVDSPPPGTVIVSVLGPGGQWTDVEPDTDTLMVELATPEDAAELGHGL